jgi:hypothetical protein
MGTMTDEFYDEIRTSHTAFSYVDVIAPDQEAKRLITIEGEVTCDRTAQVRRSLTCRAIDPLGDITPRKTGEILTPYGTELRAYRGVRYSDGRTETCALGVFRLARSVISDKSDGTSDIQLEAYDRSRTIQRDKFVTPYTITAGTNLLTAIKQIVQRTFPDATYDAIGTSLVTTAPMLFDSGGDPWEACSMLAKSMGCEIYFDVEGRVAIVPPHDINALPAADFSYIEGDRCTMLDLGRVFSDEPGYNGIIVTGESPGDEKPPVRGEAWDTSPTSPTYRYGNYGEVPAFITDSTAKTTEDCERIAKSELALTLGSSSQISLTATVNPSYEAGAVVGIKRQRSGVDGLFIVDAFNVPLDISATQRLNLRERRAA